MIVGNFIPLKNSSISQENILGGRREKKKISQNVRKKEKGGGGVEKNKNQKTSGTAACLKMGPKQRTHKKGK